MFGWIKGKFYRVIMRLAHRFNWHYAPPIHPGGDTMLWCHWCGLRYIKPSQAAPNTMEGHDLSR